MALRLAMAQVQPVLSGLLQEVVDRFAMFGSDRFVLEEGPVTVGGVGVGGVGLGREEHAVGHHEGVVPGLLGHPAIDRGVSRDKAALGLGPEEWLVLASESDRALAATATKVDPTSVNQGPPASSLDLVGHIYEQGWVQNAAGFWFHDWYGFGRANVDNAVAMAKA